ncbi:hypothetical protein GCM10027203_77850 [Nonomuraea fastidiosa]
MAVAGTIGALAPARAAYTPDTAFVLLRRRRREVTAGPPHDPEARPYRALGRAAARHLATMDPRSSSLWGPRRVAALWGVTAGAAADEGAGVWQELA